MKLLVWPSMAVLFIACVHTSNAALPVYASRIRVRVAEAVPKVRVRGFDLRIFASKGTAANSLAGRTLAAAPDRASEWELHCQNGRIRALPMGGNASTQALDLQEPVHINSPTGFVNLSGRPYREELVIRSDGSLCEVVNHVDLEKYLDGLVNSEFNSKWNEESIGAQVIAARTYALHQMQLAQARLDQQYDVDATTRDQVYDGSTKEDFRSSRSVERTRGMVLTVGNSPLKAFYHSTCGGMTELPEHVWGGSHPGFKRAVRCPYCQVSPAFQWKLELSVTEVSNAFRTALASNEREEDSRRPAFAKGWPKGWRKAIREGRLTELRTGALNAEGRVASVITVWVSASGPILIPLAGAKFREWLGPARFRSAAFQVSAARGGKWLIQGRGNGHGVGMCQWGAKTMGERGFKTATILQHYYPDAVLKKLW